MKLLQVLSLLFLKLHAISAFATSISGDCVSLLNGRGSYVETLDIDLRNSKSAESKSAIKSSARLSKPEALSILNELARNRYTKLASALGVRALPGESIMPELPLSAKKSVEDLADIISNPDFTPAKRRKLASKWVTSHLHAAVLYEILWDMPDDGKSILAYLQTHNRFFKDTLSVKGKPQALIMSSFEKETHNGEALTYFYRPSRMTEVEWMKLSPKSRLESLLNARDSFYPTGLLPDYLSSLTFELPTSGSGTILEVKSEGFVLDVDRLHAQVDEVAEYVGLRGRKETHSFQIHHAVFLDKHEVESVDFVVWYQMMNRYFYFYGYENGLATNRFSNTLPIYDLTMEKLRSLGFRKDIYKNEWLRARYNKFGWLGTSGEVVGLELRDVTRDLSKLKTISKAVASSLAKKIWDEKKYSGIWRAQNIFWRHQANAMRTAKPILEPMFPERVSAIEFDGWAESSGIFIPLLDYSRMPIFKPSVAEITYLGEDELQVIENSRQSYLKCIAGVANEVRADTSVDLDILRAAINICLMEWAKEVKLSRYLNPLQAVGLSPEL